MHCNPAPPHPPPGEIYNVICLGRPYINGVPVGYVVLGVVTLAVIVSMYRLDHSEVVADD